LTAVTAHLHTAARLHLEQSFSPLPSSPYNLNTIQLVPPSSYRILISTEMTLLQKATDEKDSFARHPLWQRYCYVLLMAAWMGGFTFYALIVIPTAERVLNSMRETGFITQQVTRWLNLTGAGILPILLWLLALGCRKQPARLRLGLFATWTIMLLAQVALFITHPLIDRFLESQGHKLHHYEQFENMHTIYLVFATVQWSAALLQIWLMLASWRLQDATNQISQAR
jgi:hypothetical protein